MTRARFLPEAEDEFAEAVQFYERAEIGLGSVFMLEVERTVERLCAFPESGTTFSASSRGRITANFPFWVIYRADAAEVTHHRDSPSTPQARLLAEEEGCAPLTTRWSGP